MSYAKRNIFHQLWHTHIISVLFVREPLTVISERLGQAYIKTTLSIYQYVTI